MERLTRRQFLKAIPFIGATLSLVACAQGTEPLPTVVSVSNVTAKGSYPLTEESDGSLRDGNRDFSQHPFLEAIRFSFDGARAGGSLVMVTTFRQGNEFRLVTEETDKVSPEGPGLIYNKSTKEPAGLTPPKFPIIRFGLREWYLLSLGFKLPGEDCLTTYQKMLTYSITRDGNGKLQGRFEGLRTFDPNASYFKPRDNEARRLYWQPDCLT